MTDLIKPAKSKELTLQALIAMLNEEYGFEMSDMERDFNFPYTDLEASENCVFGLWTIGDEFHFLQKETDEW